MVYGYARISRPTQNIERQIRNITEFEPTAKVFKEAYTGTTQARPEWLKRNRQINHRIALRPVNVRKYKQKRSVWL